LTAVFDVLYTAGGLRSASTRALEHHHREHPSPTASVTPEYDAAARRYFGDEAGAQWVENVRQLGAGVVRIAIRPQWVGILDFEQRFPSAIHDALTGAAG
jgi:hypothetical protein